MIMKEMFKQAGSTVNMVEVFEHAVAVTPSLPTVLIGTMVNITPTRA